MNRYHSALDLAHALQDTAPRKLGLLLYNEHRPDSTPVWLLPDPYEKPAHHRVKLGVWPWGDDGQQVFVQWCVEKGVQGSAAGHFPASDMLGPHWAWQRFMTEAMNRSFDGRLKDAAARAGEPLTVRIDLGTAVPGRGRDYRGTAWQRAVWHAQQGQLVPVASHSGPEPFNEQLAEANSVRTLALLLSQTPSLDWCWIDFGVGVVLPLRQDTEGAAELWAHVLAPWLDEL